MRNIILNVALMVTAAGLLAPAGANPAAVKAPTHTASDMPIAGLDACLGRMRLLSHAAYIPAVTQRAVRCGHYLPTDTMMTVRRWDRT
jgi:hypothetical protein